MERRLRDRIAAARKRLSRLLKRRIPEAPPEAPPDDPYAYVGAPKKPRLPQRGAAAAEALE